MKNKIKNYLILGIILIFAYFLSRLINLTVFPVFADEAIYIRWAQVMRAEPSLRFLPLSVGSPPFFMWIMMPFLKTFVDPLFAGRLLSVFCGFGSLIGLFFISFLIFNNKRLSFFSTMFYAVVPYYVFSERLALIDSMLSLQGIWLTILAILLVKKPKLDLSIIAGIILGISLMTKSFAIFFLIPLFSAFLLKKWDLKDKKTTFISFVKITLGLILILVIGFGIYNFILRLGPNFTLINSRNDMGIYSFQEIIKHPLDPLVPHLKDLADWLPNLITPVIFCLSFLGFVVGIKKKRPETFFLILCSFGPILVESFISKGFTPRYLLFAVWPFIIMAAYALDILFTKIKKKAPKLISANFFYALLILLVVLSAVKYDFFLLTQPEKSPLPRNLRSGHLEEWTAGQGIRETAALLKSRLPGKKILVGTEGFFGTLPDGLQIYFQNIPNITILGIGLYPEKIPQPLLNSLADHDEVYLVINDERLSFNPEIRNVTIVDRFPKAIRPNGTFQSLLLMKINKGPDEK